MTIDSVDKKAAFVPRIFVKRRMNSKVFQLLVIMGGILAIVGIFLAGPPVPYSTNYTASIPSGNWVSRFSLDLTKQGHISGTFSELSGNSVRLYIFSSAQYSAYQNGAGSTSIDEEYGSNGAFSATVPFPGTYYIVLVHGLFSHNLDQSVQVSLVIDGVNNEYLASGIGVATAGIALAYVGYTRRRKTIPSRKVTDVIMSDRPRQESGQSAYLGPTAPSPFVQQPRAKGKLDCPVCGLYFTPELAGSCEWAKMHYNEHLTRIHPDYAKLHRRWNSALISMVVLVIIFSLGLLVNPIRYFPAFVISVVTLFMVITLRTMSLGGRREAWYRLMTTSQ